MAVQTPYIRLFFVVLLALHSSALPLGLNSDAETLLIARADNPNDPQRPASPGGGTYNVGGWSVTPQSGIAISPSFEGNNAPEGPVFNSATSGQISASPSQQSTAVNVGAPPNPNRLQRMQNRLDNAGATMRRWGRQIARPFSRPGSRPSTPDNDAPPQNQGGPPPPPAAGGQGGGQASGGQASGQASTSGGQTTRGAPRSPSAQRGVPATKNAGGTNRPNNAPKGGLKVTPKGPAKGGKQAQRNPGANTKATKGKGTPKNVKAPARAAKGGKKATNAPAAKKTANKGAKAPATMVKKTATNKGAKAPAKTVKKAATNKGAKAPAKTVKKTANNGAKAPAKMVKKAANNGAKAPARMAQKTANRAAKAPAKAAQGKGRK